jgi:cytochrome c peroxidase
VRKRLLTILVLFTSVIALSYLVGACKKEQNTKGVELVSISVPAGFPAPVQNFAGNPLSKEGIELGRKLFYDGRLAIDNFHSCASCHQQIAGFGTFEHDRSHGVNNTHTIRNAPVLFNLAWNKSFHWDSAFVKLDDAIAQPLHGNNEMGETYTGIINKIKDDKDYQQRFKQVFSSSIIRPEYILKALAQFTGHLVSANSKYDRYKKGEVTFTAQEESGYQLYKTKCATCHPEPLFTDNSYRNIGFPIDGFLKDYGLMRVTGRKQDSLKFKVPTLRNTYISSNYMHDGRFATLGQCINHYRTGVQAGSTLDPSLTGGITMTNTEANNLFVFLRALTDSAFITNPRYAKP